MPQEIERKFLVIDSVQAMKGTTYLIRQGYIFNEIDKSLRVRICSDGATVPIYRGIGRAYITLKTRVSDIIRNEYEYEIPVEHALEMYENIPEFSKLEKIRCNPFVYPPLEVDLFKGKNDGLVVAEIELQSEAQEFERPDWLGEEVTHDPRYINANLVKNPYCNWKPK